MKKALFAGSFDPFTLGHKSIVDRALTLVDDVIIGIGVNSQKTCMYNLEERIKRIRMVYASNPHVTVMSYEGLTTDFARENGADILIKGIRSYTDFEYEKAMADINRQLTGIETVLLFADEKYCAISSTIVRELIKYNKDVSQYLP